MKLIHDEYTQTIDLICRSVANFQIKLQDMTKITTSAHLKTDAGIIWLSGAASITDCQVFVDPGMTNPKSKYHSKIPSEKAINIDFIVFKYCYIENPTLTEL